PELDAPPWRFAVERRHGKPVPGRRTESAGEEPRHASCLCLSPPHDDARRRRENDRPALRRLRERLRDDAREARRRAPPPGGGISAHERHYEQWAEREA